MLGQVERRMLPGRDDQRVETAVTQRRGERGEFDGFGAGADD
jgi:hypothetical protein